MRTKSRLSKSQRTTKRRSPKPLDPAVTILSPSGVVKIHPQMRQFLGFCLYKFALSIRGRFEEKIQVHGLLAPQCAILKLLDSEGTMTQSELGSYLAIDKATAVRLIDGLEGNGYVTRTEDTNDRRAKQLAITSRGRSTLEKAAIARQAAESEALSPLTESERKQFRELVAKLTLE